MKEALPGLLKEVERQYTLKPARMLEAFCQIVGPEIAAEARPDRFEGGILYVTVANATLLSLLKRNEKERVIEELRRRLPELSLKEIRFRIG